MRGRPLDAIMCGAMSLYSPRLHDAGPRAGLAACRRGIYVTRDQHYVGSPFDQTVPLRKTP